jgi:hypothetical protein
MLNDIHHYNKCNHIMHCVALSSKISYIKCFLCGCHSRHYAGVVDTVGWTEEQDANLEEATIWLMKGSCKKCSWNWMVLSRSGEKLLQLCLSSWLKLWECFIIFMACLVIQGWYVLTLAMTSVLLKSVLCFVSGECSGTAGSWFFSLVPDIYILPYEQRILWTPDFWARLSVLGWPEAGCHFVNGFCTVWIQRESGAPLE